MGVPYLLLNADGTAPLLDWSDGVPKARIAGLVPGDDKCDCCGPEPTCCTVQSTSNPAVFAAYSTGAQADTAWLLDGSVIDWGIFDPGDRTALQDAFAAVATRTVSNMTGYCDSTNPAAVKFNWSGSGVAFSNQSIWSLTTVAGNGPDTSTTYSAQLVMTATWPVSGETTGCGIIPTPGTASFATATVTLSKSVYDPITEGWIVPVSEIIGVPISYWSARVHENKCCANGSAGVYTGAETCNSNASDGQCVTAGVMQALAASPCIGCGPPQTPPRNALEQMQREREILEGDFA